MFEVEIRFYITS